MGIDVDAHKVVTFSALHQHRVVTDPTRPIPKVRYGRLKIVSVFRRQITSHDGDDGNPLIYALKGKFGYTMPYRDFCTDRTCTLRSLNMRRFSQGSAGSGSAASGHVVGTR